MLTLNTVGILYTFTTRFNIPKSNILPTQYTGPSKATDPATRRIY